MSVSTDRFSLWFRSVPALAVLLVALSLTVAATYYAAASAEAKDTLRFESLVQQTRDSLHNRLETYIALLRAAAGLFAASERVDRHEFRAFVRRQGVQEHYPGIQGIGFSRRIKASDKDSVIAAMRRQGLAAFQIRPALPRRGEYHAILYLEPLNRRNQAAIGYDMFTHPVRRAAMERARDTGMAAASGRVTLVQEIDQQKQAGFLIYVPVYRGKDVPKTLAERRAALLGYVYSPFRADDLLLGIFGMEARPRLDLQVYDGLTRTSEHLLHDSRRFHTAPRSPGRPHFIRTITIEVAGRPCSLVIGTRPEFEWDSGHGQVPYVFLVGLALSAVLFGVTRSQARAQAAAERAAAQLRQFAHALAESEERMRLIVDTALDAVVTIDAEGRITGWNVQAEKSFGWSAQEVLGQQLAATIIPPQYREAHERGLKRFLETGEGAMLNRRIEITALHRDGHEFPVELTVAPARLGEAWVLSAFVRDITERKRLEQALFQAQKMESIGRLAGGIAHDFNNLLTVIIGFSEMAEEGLPANSPLGNHLQNIRAAGERASTLTQQLLAFARRQIIEPKSIDLNELVLDLALMLRRLIGEDIELVIRPQADLWPVKADLSQLEQVLVNLAANARDAMPQGGQLSIEMANVLLDEDYARAHPEVVPGEYVMLAVSDTGVGMEESVQQHVFEPFFTTKGRGKGTGLGLATCYGIVKQSGGHIWLYSEPGRGTTFKIYLPRTREPVTDSMCPAALAAPSGHETILVVEDEASVLDFAVEALRAQGYKVLAASDGREALGVATEYEGPIDLVVTDVIMPHMSGKAFVDRLLPLRPGVRILYTSGYTDSIILHHGVGGAGVAFLQKPYSLIGLARKVREVLDVEDASVPDTPSGQQA